jgi:hypothetical protein
MSKTNLKNANLEEADLSKSNRTDATLEGVKLSHANLKGARLTRARVLGAFLFESDLSDASLVSAIIIGCKGINKSKISRDTKVDHVITDSPWLHRKLGSAFPESFRFADTNEELRSLLLAGHSGESEEDVERILNYHRLYD